MATNDEQPIDYDELRRRFPWVGLAEEVTDTDLAAHHREILAGYLTAHAAQQPLGA